MRGTHSSFKSGYDVRLDSKAKSFRIHETTENHFLPCLPVVPLVLPPSSAPPPLSSVSLAAAFCFFLVNSTAFLLRMADQIDNENFGDLSNNLAEAKTDIRVWIRIMPPKHLEPIESITGPSFIRTRRASFRQEFAQLGIRLEKMITHLFTPAGDLAGEEDAPAADALTGVFNAGISSPLAFLPPSDSELGARCRFRPFPLFAEAPGL